MTKPEIIKVDDAKTIPAKHPIVNLRFKSSGWYTVAYIKLHSNAIAGLKAAGIVLVSDLKDHSESTLKKIKGVGDSTAKKLIMAAKKASVKYRGIGFPYEVEVAVFVPDGAVEYVRELGSEASETMIADYISGVFFESIEENVKTAKKSRIQAELDKSLASVRTLKQAMKELEA